MLGRASPGDSGVDRMLRHEDSHSGSHHSVGRIWDRLARALSTRKAHVSKCKSLSRRPTIGLPSITIAVACGPLADGSTVLHHDPSSNRWSEWIPGSPEGPGSWSPITRAEAKVLTGGK